MKRPAFFPPLLPLQPLFKVNVQHGSRSVKMPTSFPWIISHCGSLPRPLSVWPANEPVTVGSARRACLIRCSLRQRWSADDGDEDGHEEEEGGGGGIRLSREKQFRGPFCPACGHASILPVREEHFCPLLLFTRRRHFVLCWTPPTHSSISLKRATRRQEYRCKVEGVGDSFCKSPSLTRRSRLFSFYFWRGGCKRPLLTEPELLRVNGERWHLPSPGTMSR